MPFVPTLRAFPPPLRLEVPPLARLREDGSLDACSPWLPFEGPCLLVLWRPGEEPGFEAARGALRRQGGGWRFDGQARPGWVILQAAVPGAAGKGS